MTNTEVGPSVKLDSVSRQAHAEEFHDGRQGKFKPHQVAVKISRGVHSEVPEEDPVPAAEALSRRGISEVGTAKGESD